MSWLTAEWDELLLLLTLEWDILSYSFANSTARWLEAPGVCPTDSAEYAFQLTLQYLCDSALRWGMWIFLDDYRVPVGMGNREYIPCESYMPHILTRKNEPDPLVQTGFELVSFWHVTQIHSGSWTLVTIFPWQSEYWGFLRVWSQKWTNKHPMSLWQGIHQRHLL